MSTVSLDNEAKETVQEAVELLDCGRASERTKGIPLPIILELGIPPAQYGFTD